MKLAPGWPESLMEAALLGVFMFSACVFASLFEDPASFVRAAAGSFLDDAFVRRCLMGTAMGLTAVGIFYSPWARRCGAHINPAVTLTLWRLDRITTAGALAYGAAQFCGGTAGVVLAAAVVGDPIGIPAVNYAVTMPGAAGTGPALAGEFAICFTMMGTALLCQSFEGAKRFGGLACATLLALFIVFESPLSGTSLNPARTFASAIAAGLWTNAWIYFLAPPLGMLAAGELYRRVFAHVCDSDDADPGFAACIAADVRPRRTA